MHPDTCRYKGLKESEDKRYSVLIVTECGERHMPAIPIYASSKSEAGEMMARSVESLGQKVKYCSSRLYEKPEDTDYD